MLLFTAEFAFIPKFTFTFLALKVFCSPLIHFNVISNWKKWAQPFSTQIISWPIYVYWTVVFGNHLEKYCENNIFFVLRLTCSSQSLCSFLWWRIKEVKQKSSQQLSDLYDTVLTICDADTLIDKLLDLVLHRVSCSSCLYFKYFSQRGILQQCYMCSWFEAEASFALLSIISTPKAAPILRSFIPYTRSNIHQTKKKKCRNLQQMEVNRMEDSDHQLQRNGIAV